MKRLTVKQKEKLLVEHDYEYYSLQNGVCYNDGIKKLGQLEDIEKELGIYFITLFKALKHGIWYKEDHEVKQFIPNERMHIVADCNGSDERTNYWVLSLIDLDSEKCLTDLRVTDYGLTWALTKEELDEM